MDDDEYEEYLTLIPTDHKFHEASQGRFDFQQDELRDEFDPDNTHPQDFLWENQ